MFSNLTILRSIINYFALCILVCIMRLFLLCFVKYFEAARCKLYFLGSLLSLLLICYNNNNIIIIIISSSSIILLILLFLFTSTTVLLSVNLIRFLNEECNY